METTSNQDLEWAMREVKSQAEYLKWEHEKFMKRNLPTLDDIVRAGEEIAKEAHRG